MVSRERVLERREILLVLSNLKKSIRRWKTNQTKLYLTIFRLSCCCGLRACEIRQLKMKDMKLGGESPFVRIPAAISKGHGKDGKITRKGRLVPLSWCTDTRDDLVAWYKNRQSHGAGDDDLFVCSVRKGSFGNPIDRNQVGSMWNSALRSLGQERRKVLSVHCGRHSYITHAIYAGVPLPAVQKAAGHASIQTTSLYTHVLDEPVARRDLFSPAYVDRNAAPASNPPGDTGQFPRIAVG